MDTSSPRFCSALTRCDPMNPAPPVTRTFTSGHPLERCAFGAVFLLPELEHEQGPEGLSVIGAAVEVRFQQCAHRRGLEDAALLERALAEDLFEERPHGPANPGCHGDAEALLGAAEDLFRHHALERLL